MAAEEHRSWLHIRLVVGEGMDVDAVLILVALEVLLPERAERQRPHRQEHERKLGSPDDGQPRATRSHGGSPQELLVTHALIQILVILHALLIVQHAPPVPQRRNPDGTRRQNADPQVAQQLQRQENPQSARLCIYTAFTFTLHLQLPHVGFSGHGNS